MTEDILNAANLYNTGLQLVTQKREQWQKTHLQLKDQLREIAAFLNDKALYKQGFFVDSLHAYNEEMNGTCSEMPSLTFRSGDMPMHVTFRNSLGERKDFIEEGFRITFNPTISGQIVVLLYPHHTFLSNKNTPSFVTLAVFEEPAQITHEIAEQIIANGVAIAFTSSFTGAGHAKNEPEEPRPNPTPPPEHHSIIGFKRYETTEKVK